MLYEQITKLRACKLCITDYVKDLLLPKAVRIRRSQGGKGVRMCPIRRLSRSTNCPACQGHLTANVLYTHKMLKTSMLLMLPPPRSLLERIPGPADLSAKR